MKKKTRLIILVFAIMAVAAAGIYAVSPRQPENTDTRYTGQPGSNSAGQYTIAIYEENGWMIMITSEEAYIPAKVNAMTKFALIIALIALAAAALIVFAALSYDTAWNGGK